MYMPILSLMQNLARCTWQTLSTCLTCSAISLRSLWVVKWVNIAFIFKHCEAIPIEYSNACSCTQTKHNWLASINECARIFVVATWQLFEIFAMFCGRFWAPRFFFCFLLLIVLRNYSMNVWSCIGHYRLLRRPIRRLFLVGAHCPALCRHCADPIL